MILYQDEHLVAFEKPAWWLTHPSDEARHIKENALTYVRDLVGCYVYPVNRLDLQSSGILLFSKDPSLVKILKSNWHEFTKSYYALVRGDFEESEGTFDFELSNDNGVPRPAKTTFKIINQFEGFAFADIKIHTGRRHQIRRHFSRRMHALIGDRKYGKKKWNDPFKEKYGLNRLFLHAHTLEFIHPVSNENILITSDLPQILSTIIKDLRNE